MLALVLGILAVSYAYPLRAWWEQHSRVAELEAEQESLAAEVAALEGERDRWEDPAFVRTQARERLGLVTPGEVGFVVVGEGDGPTEVLIGEGDEAVTSVETEGPWWSRLLASVEAADAVSDEGVAGSPAGNGAAEGSEGAEEGSEDAPEEGSDDPAQDGADVLSEDGADVLSEDGTGDPSEDSTP
ncbi:MAG TPA: septum formation initiator family protein [Jiangellales bacterium]|nr:septum formation initiator family protein [Jiangellales bacterium]